MPALQQSTSKHLVLVTGTTGYIASWVVRYLLERGYNVRGAVRSTSKGQQTMETFGKLSGYGEPNFGKFEYVVVEDIAKEGAFDEAVKGVDAIEHLASPVIFDPDVDPKELIEPAVKGAVGILESAKKYGEKVKRVVITSSAAAIIKPGGENNTYDESDWNDVSVKETEELGRKAPGLTKYRASKTLAERAVWAFASANSSLPFDIVTINPPFVYGPTTNYVSTPENLSISAADWYKTVVAKYAENQSSEYLETKFTCWVDVRDVAEAHIRALVKEEAGGKRIIVSVEPFFWQEWLDVANSLTPLPYTKHPLSRGNPGVESSARPHAIYNAERAKQILGISGDEDAEWRYKTKEETARDMLIEFAARGW
ncbi:D-lactaldehyde dehydrogenase [Marasmius fiardii PR-910]|nr:D-lactaldehyde dehydrogenase [Marasmius fiardii PR-910]